MIKFRLYSIVAIDAAILLWLLLAIAFDENSEYAKLVVMGTLVNLLFYNVYTLLLYTFFPSSTKHRLYSEGLYLLLLLLPFLLLFAR